MVNPIGMNMSNHRYCCQFHTSHTYIKRKTIFQWLRIKYKKTTHEPKWRRYIHMCTIKSNLQFSFLFKNKNDSYSFVLRSPRKFNFKLKHFFFTILYFEKVILCENLTWPALKERGIQLKDNKKFTAFPLFSIYRVVENSKILYIICIYQYKN